jgi:stringent starvation protein B
MTAFTSTKPYMIRAIHEWCVDNGCTPHLLVTVNSRTRVPLAYVKDRRFSSVGRAPAL